LIRVVVDSTCDLPAEWVRRYQISVVPIHIQFGTQSYREGVDIDRDMFYRKVEATHTLPKTSQPSPGEFVETYRRIACKGDTLISIHVTGKLSGTCQSAQLAARELGGALDVRVFDSRGGSAGVGYMAVEAMRMAQAGESVDAILVRLEQMRRDIHILLSPENLKYLQMSGRVSNVQALIGGMLSLKPIIALEDGMLQPAARVRTRAKALERMLAMTGDYAGARPVKLAVVHAQAQPAADKLMSCARDRFNVQEAFVVDLATSLAVHFGPGCLGIVSWLLE
jgi:DegV family protein with EDD domain